MQCCSIFDAGERCSGVCQITTRYEIRVLQNGDTDQRCRSIGKLVANFGSQIGKASLVEWVKWERVVGYWGCVRRVAGPVSAQSALVPLNY